MKGLFTTTADRQSQRRDQKWRNLLRAEAKIGGTVFGPVPKGTRREFFCLESGTWVWHEEWTGKKGQRHSTTTRYELRPDGILKSQGGHSYQLVSREEAVRLQQAIHLFGERVRSELLHTA